MALIDRTGATVLIPEPQTREIIKGLPAASVALSQMRRVPMSSKVQNMPVLSALPTAYFVNGDTGQKRTTSAAWAKKTLTAEEIAVIVPIPEAVLDDSDYDIFGEIKPLLIEAIGVCIDAAVLHGTNIPASWTDGAIVPTAIARGNSYERGSVVGQGFDLDVSKTMRLHEADGFRSTGFVAIPSIEADLRELRDANGNPLFLPTVGSSTPGTLYGKPLFYPQNDAMDETAAELVSGDWSQAIIAVRQDVTTKILSEATIYDTDGTTILYRLAQQDMVALRVVFRLAFAVANPISRRNPNPSTSYPFAVLTPNVP